MHQKRHQGKNPREQPVGRVPRNETAQNRGDQGHHQRKFCEGFARFAGEPTMHRKKYKAACAKHVGHTLGGKAAHAEPKVLWNSHRPPANDERSHAGPLTPDTPQRNLPALAGAIGRPARSQALPSAFS